MLQHWNINGENWPARVIFSGPLDPGWPSEPQLGVRMEYRGLHAYWPIRVTDGQAFATFFAEVARRRDENLAGLAVHSLDSDLTISADQGGHRGWKCIELTVKLSCDTQDPFWSSELVLGIPKDQLGELALEAERFFAAIHGE